MTQSGRMFRLPQIPQGLTADEYWLSWTHTSENGALRASHVLEDVSHLSRADPKDMRAFFKNYGILELCGKHGAPDRHFPMGERRCPFVARDGREGVRISHIRALARAIESAPRIARALSDRSVLRWEDGWNDLEALVPHKFRPVPEELDDWKLAREHFANLMELFVRATAPHIGVRWGWKESLRLETVDNGLIGVIADLLIRECARGGSVQIPCDVCSQFFVPRRPPRRGEGRYCDEQPCQRERLRRNQQNRRQRVKQEGGKDG